MPINRPVRVVTKDGTIINGRRLNEDTYSLQIIDDRERLHSLREGRPARVHDLDDVADAVLQGHALGRGDCRRARLSAFAERTVAMTGTRRLFAWSFVSLLIGLLSFRVHGQVTPQRLAAAPNEPQNWLTYSGNYSSTRYSPLNQITPANVKNLKLQWVYQSPVAGNWQTTPLVVDGIMYITQRLNDVVALDAATGRAFWIYRYTPAPGSHRLLRRQQPRARDSRRHAVHGHARRAADRDRREDRAAALEDRGREHHGSATRSRTRRWSSRTRSSSASAAASTASAASSRPTTRRPARKRGASTRFRRRASPVPRRGSAVRPDRRPSAIPTRGSMAADRSG